MFAIAAVVIQCWHRVGATVPGPFRAALMIALGFVGFVAWDQSHWWRVKPDYGFGWLVPLLVAFVLHDRWPRIAAALRACAAEGSPRAGGAKRWLLGAVVGAALSGGMLFFLLGSFYRAEAGSSPPGTLAITLGMVGIVLALLFVHAPETRSPKPSSITNDARVRLTRLFLFPVFVWLISAPIVAAVETQLNLALLRRVVGVVAFVFDTLGLPIEQQGNVLALPAGNVGVEDACSGIRSLTGCLFAGSFLAAVFAERRWQKCALIAAALLLALVTNLLRSLFLTAWAYRFGPQAIEGTVHDVAGYAVLALTVTALAASLPMLTRGAPLRRPRLNTTGR